MRTSKRTFGAWAIASALALVGALLLTSGTADDSQASGIQVQSIGRDLAARFAVLDKPDTKHDSLAARRLDGIERQARANRSLARRLDEGKSRVGVWLIPGRQSLCLLVRLDDADGGEACRRISDTQSDILMTLSGGPSGTSGLRPDQVIVAGAVPNGIRQVTLTMLDGAHHTLKVVNNGFWADVYGATSSVSYVANDGNTITQYAPPLGSTP